MPKSGPLLAFVVGDSGVSHMFRRRNGWDTADSVKDADIVQFTGGADVHPSLYGHTEHPKTFAVPARDKKEMMIFRLALALKKPMAGICRGGQFLNVMNGGTMWQHVDNHVGRGTHKVIDKITGEVFDVTSTHHQMMIRAKGGKLIGVAHESHNRELHINNKLIHNRALPGAFEDNEIVYYPKTNCFCFQPHPEYGAKELEDRYFAYLQEYLLPAPTTETK